MGITSEEGVGGHRCMQDDIGEEGSLVQGIKRSYRGSLGVTVPCRSSNCQGIKRSYRGHWGLLFHAGVVIARGSRGVNYRGSLGVTVPCRSGNCQGIKRSYRGSLGVTVPCRSGNCQGIKRSCSDTATSYYSLECDSRTSRQVTS